MEHVLEYITNTVMLQNINYIRQYKGVFLLFILVGKYE